MSSSAYFFVGTCAYISFLRIADIVSNHRLLFSPQFGIFTASL